jgi:MFS transporter, DHA2 family, multidrug resistance protein
MSTDAGTRSEDGARPIPASPWIIAPTVGLAAFMEVLDISIVNVSLQHVAGSMAATPDEATWILTSYLVTNAIVLPISGWLSQTFGRKRYFLFSIIGFSVTSLVCGLAPSLGFLIVARGLQGMTGGGLQPTAQAFLADAFPPERRGQAFAAYGLAVVFGPAIGPTVGGWITDNIDWRWVFLINVPVGAIVSLLAMNVLPDPSAEREARKAQWAKGLNFDYLGFGFLAIGMAALQVVLDKGQEDDWFASSMIADLSVTAAVTLVAFAIWELRRADPIVDLHLFRDRAFASGNVMMFMLGFALLGTTAMLPLFVQTLLGYTAEQAGLVLSPGGFATMLMMPVAGALSGRIDARVLITVGLVGTAIAMFHMSGFDIGVDYSTLAWARIYQSLGLALLFIPINTAAYQGVPADKNANASAIINMMRNIGGSVGISILDTYIARREQANQVTLIRHVTPYAAPTSKTLQTLQQMYQAGHGSAVGAMHAAQAQLYSVVQTQAAVLSYIDAFWLVGAVLVAMIPLVVLLRRPQPQGRGGTASASASAAIH